MAPGSLESYFTIAMKFVVSFCSCFFSSSCSKWAQFQMTRAKQNKTKIIFYFIVPYFSWIKWMALKMKVFASIRLAIMISTIMDLNGIHSFWLNGIHTLVQKNWSCNWCWTICFSRMHTRFLRNLSGKHTIGQWVSNKWNLSTI